MAEAIQSISMRQFEQFGAARNPAMHMFVEELEFYSILDGWYLGVLLRDRSDHDFSYAVLGPDPKGARRWIGGGDSIASIDDARARLKALLTQFADKGKRIHEQD